MSQRFVRDDGSVKESVLDMVVNIDPTETYLLSNLQRSKANDEFHFVPRDTLRTPTIRASVDGADTSFDGTDPTKVMNVLQTIEVGYNVTDSENATDRFGSPNERFAYETDKALKDWSNFAEASLMRSTVVTGNNSTARQMNGLKASLTLSTNQSGISLTQTIVDSYLQNAWDKGVDVDTILAPMKMKMRLSSFNNNGGTQRYADQNDKRLVQPIELYESDASSRPIKLIPHRYVTWSGDTNYDIVGIEADKFAVAYLREPKVEKLAKTGDAEKGRVVGELTLEVRSDLAGFVGQKHI